MGRQMRNGTWETGNEKWEMGKGNWEREVNIKRNKNGITQRGDINAMRLRERKRGNSVCFEGDNWII